VVGETLITFGVRISPNCFLSISCPFEKGKNKLAADTRRLVATTRLLRLSAIDGGQACRHNGCHALRAHQKPFLPISAQSEQPKPLSHRHTQTVSHRRDAEIDYLAEPIDLSS
jgi:hypothetical protein